ncbi:MAG TPA: hypothetical protein ENJ35_10200 [Gammaproteobacteria bacterium]|nr:hypothetical protein [Gammaproteobacteria bacterium]
METMLLIIVGMFLYGAIDWSINHYKRSQEQKKRRESELILEKHGMIAQRYLPTIGIENKEHREALERIALEGYIIIDAEGSVVGKLLPKASKEPHLRLIVDNTSRE